MFLFSSHQNISNIFVNQFWIVQWFISYFFVHAFLNILLFFFCKFFNFVNQYKKTAYFWRELHWVKVFSSESNAARSKSAKKENRLSVSACVHLEKDIKRSAVFSFHQANFFCGLFTLHNLLWVNEVIFLILINSWNFVICNDPFDSVFFLRWNFIRFF